VARRLKWRVVFHDTARVAGAAQRVLARCAASGAHATPPPDPSVQISRKIASVVSACAMNPPVKESVRNRGMAVV